MSETPQSEDYEREIRASSGLLTSSQYGELARLTALEREILAEIARLEWGEKEAHIKIRLAYQQALRKFPGE